MPTKLLLAAVALFAAATPAFAADAAAAAPVADVSQLPFRDTALSFDKRVDDLLSRLTLAEKCAMVRSVSAPVKRLEIPRYNHWSECLHGVGAPGKHSPATCFPQGLTMAAAWNPELMHEVASAISDEARAWYHHGRKNDLTYFTPNINILRDPRWGRGLETYGEDPFLTSRLGVAFITGMQGDDPKYLKIAATAKHYAAHSGPETKRRRFDAVVSMRDLYETYLPAFKAAIQEAHTASLMTAYNQLNGVPCTANAFLLEDVARKQYGFDGYAVSDDQAAADVFAHYKLGKNQKEGGAILMNAGCDMELGAAAFKDLEQACKDGLVTVARITQAARRVLLARFKLGCFDPDDKVPYAAIPESVIGGERSRKAALEMGRQSLVLLKNTPGALPLDAGKLKKVAVIGPNADCPETLLTSYFWSKPTAMVTPLAGITKRLAGKAEVAYSRGCPWVDSPKTPADPAETKKAVELAAQSDVTILVLGAVGREHYGPSMEGEFRDRDIALSKTQEDLMAAVAATGKPYVVVLMSGGPLTSVTAAEKAPAVLMAGYNSQEGGTAIAEALFGDYNPGGKMPCTVYRDAKDLPDFENYSMDGRTYRFFKGKPLYAFGHGLSYTTFEFDRPAAPAELAASTGEIEVSVRVKNTGARDGDEVVQLYLRHLNPSVRAPLKTLVGFRRVSVKAGATETVTLKVKRERFELHRDDGTAFVSPGACELQLGSASDAIRATLPITVR